VAHLLRRIVKRPIVYLSASLVLLAGIGAFFVARPKPQYCWLVFGSNAQVRVLVSLDGKTVSLDHYADGKPTGRSDRFRIDRDFEKVILADPDGVTSYVITRMHDPEVPAGAHPELFVNVDVKGPVNYHQYCDVGEMANDPENAPLSHFHAPLTVEVRKVNFEIYPGLALKRGEKPANISAVVGTMDPRKNCWVVVSSQDENGDKFFPDDVYPVVDVEFPPANDGDPPIRRRYSLDHVC
jgi:hypothetical protein